MSQINQSLIQAIKGMLNHRPNSIAKLSWSQGNTAVVGATQKGYEVLEVRLHNSVIAVITPDKQAIELNNAGFATGLTHSRMNAVLDAFDLAHIRAKKQGKNTVFTIHSQKLYTLSTTRTTVYYKDKAAA